MEAFDALQLPDHKKRYILETLNPLLEQVVADTIDACPNDPMMYMLELLQMKRIEEEERDLTEDQHSQLVADNEVLRQKLATITSQLGQVVKSTTETTSYEKEVDVDDEDEDEEPPPGFFDQPVTSKVRASVSAEPQGEYANALKAAFCPRIVYKSAEQKVKLKGMLTKSFVFSELAEIEIDVIVNAMVDVVVDKGQRVINEGDAGDFLFVVESGRLDVSRKTKSGPPEVVKTCVAGDVFGELALLYNCARAATVEAVEDSALWKLDRATFSHFMQDAAQKKRNRYDGFLSKVPLFAALTANERSLIVDALRPDSFTAGTDIIKQGDAGHMFYIVEDGEAIVLKNDVEVMSYQPGDTFGELALIMQMPRAATVKCKTDVKCLCLDDSSFKRLLNVEMVMARCNYA
eukprot:TRINITY_DN74013_c0_g1_i1.p1 TRINITY_DN74013_c0_g1~~TRINITY_DN74013_c0_g1_i1.p1  ORF type:complete len:405 (-),score=129.72 TRINITY_DN74013_c0_g1_i1:73-1287(-)